MRSEIKTTIDFADLAQEIKSWGMALGFQKIGISDIELTSAEQQLQHWLQKNYHGEMSYMQRHGTKRSRPTELIPDTLSVISARLDYLPPDAADSDSVMNDPSLAMISRYALGGDYHKVMRKRLQKLAHRIEKEVGTFGYRVFSDSAPVLEKPLAEKAGLGWIGKHTNLLARDSGSWFFLGEIYSDLPLPSDAVAENHCGTCQACIDICPTRAIVGPYQLDARRCISYLTIELKGSIPESLRPMMGNRIYGCDDCQLVCPWNRFAKISAEPAFQIRHGLDQPRLVELFAWSENTFLTNTQGSAIRRIGYIRWLRNIAVALGNGEPSAEAIAILQSRVNHDSDVVREHVHWALTRLIDQKNPVAVSD